MGEIFGAIAATLILGIPIVGTMGYVAVLFWRAIRHQMSKIPQAEGKGKHERSAHTE